jgi:FlaG/FlaF family flagellin (archaellin)
MAVAGYPAQDMSIRSLLVASSAAALLSLGVGCSSGGATEWPAPEARTNHIEAANAFWGFSYETPAQWRGTERGLYTVLESETRAGEIVVGRWAFTTPEEASSAVTAQWRDGGIRNTRIVEAPAQKTVAGLRAVEAVYAFADDANVEQRIRFVTLFTEWGTSLAIWGRAPAAQFDDVKTTVDALAATTKAAPPVPNKILMKELAGRWRHEASEAASSTYTFYENGTFSAAHETSAKPSDTYGHATTAGTDALGPLDEGTFTIIGSSLVLSGKAKKEIWTITRSGSGFSIGGWEYKRSQ